MSSDSAAVVFEGWTTSQLKDYVRESGGNPDRFVEKPQLIAEAVRLSKEAERQVLSRGSNYPPSSPYPPPNPYGAPPPPYGASPFPAPFGGPGYPPPAGGNYPPPYPPPSNGYPAPAYGAPAYPPPGGGPYGAPPTGQPAYPAAAPYPPPSGSYPPPAGASYPPPGSGSPYPPPSSGSPYPGAPQNGSSGPASPYPPAGSSSPYPTNNQPPAASAPPYPSEYPDRPQSQPPYPAVNPADPYAPPSSSGAAPSKSNPYPPPGPAASPYPQPAPASSPYPPPGAQAPAASYPPPASGGSPYPPLNSSDPYAPPASGGSPYPPIGSGGDPYGPPQTDKSKPIYPANAPASVQHGPPPYPVQGGNPAGGYAPSPGPPPPALAGSQPQGGGAPPHMPAGVGRRRALLCGCNYRGTASELKGCINDVKCMEYLLKSRFGFRSEEILVLTDDQPRSDKWPTRGNIFGGIQWLVGDARPGDSLFFHFSGHGSQTQDWSGDEDDGMSETICPCDYKQAGQIVDDELNRALVNPLVQGVRLHAVLDACHSGSGLDLPYRAKVRTNGQVAWKNEYTRRTRSWKGTNGGEAIQFGAAHDSQTAADTNKLSGSVSTGAATFCFIQAIERSGTRITYGQLLHEMHHALQKLMGGGSAPGGGMGGGMDGLLGALVGLALGGPGGGGGYRGQSPMMSSNQPFDLNRTLTI